jgi:hypothetical protein
MPNEQAVELREKWGQQVDRTRCKHPEQEVERGKDGILIATHYCLM